MKIMQSVLLVGVMGFVSVGGVGGRVAYAEGDPIEAAKREFEEAKAAFERGEYESSLEHFAAAQRIAPAPSLTYNIALVYERMGRFVDAANTFDKYLEELPAPNSKDERDFRDKLKQRSKSNRQRGQTKPTAPPQQPQPPNTNPQPPPPSTSPQQPPPQYPPNQPYPAQPYPAQPYPNQPYPNQPYGYGYTPYQPYGYGMGYPIVQRSPAEKITEAKERRGRAIALLSIGLVLNVTGIGLLGWGLTTDQFGGPKEAANVGIDFAGISFIITGITLWAPGAASFVRSSKDIVAAQKEQQKLDEQKRNPGRTPTAYIFNAPALTF